MLDIPEQNESYVIFSSDVPVFTQHFLTANKIGNKRVLGCYKHKQEISWIINKQDWFKILASCSTTNQECILILKPYNFTHNGRPAFLHFFDNKEDKSLGYFRQVPEEKAKKAGCYTLDGDQYYLAS